MKIIGLLFFIFHLSTVVSAYAVPLQSYQELASAVRSGERFAIVLNLQECTGDPSMPIGYFIPSKMMLIPASALSSERIVTSDLHFTDYTGNAIYEYTKYTFNPDNSVVIRTSIYDPVTFMSIGTAHVIDCTLGKGVSITTFADQSGWE